MANEIQISLNATVENGAMEYTMNPDTISITQATQGAYAAVVTVGTTAEENLAKGDVGTEGILFLRSLTAAPSTTYVTYGPSTGGAMYPIGRIEAEEVHMLRMSPGATLRWRSYGAQTKIQVLLLDD